MHELIGSTAGDIWNYLDINGQSSVIKIKSALGVPNSLLYLAIGWLSRENKIEIKEYGHSYKIAVRKEQ